MKCGVLYSGKNKNKISLTLPVLFSPSTYFGSIVGNYLSVWSTLP